MLISAGDDREYLCELVDFSGEQVMARILDVNGSNRELPVPITLYQAIPKGDKMDMIIQKAVELGAAKVVPVVTDRVIVKLDEKKKQKRVERWNGIAKAAAKQSKRNIIPEVAFPIQFSEALKEAHKKGTTIIPYEEAQGMNASREVIKGLVNAKHIAVFIGPEGGFSKEEIEQAAGLGAYPITLGHRILRTETAGMAVLSVLMFALEQD